jgi:protein-disulfide isomerase
MRFLASEIYASLARDIGLKEKTFTKCFEKQLGATLIQLDMQEAIALQIVGTPTLYINNERIGGTIKTADLITKVQQALTVK